MSPSPSAVEFANKVQPASANPSRPSKLAPHGDSLKWLAKQGYTLAQMRTFLAGEGVNVTRAAISAFLKKTADNQTATR